MIAEMITWIPFRDETEFQKQAGGTTILNTTAKPGLIWRGFLGNQLQAPTLRVYDSTILDSYEGSE